MHEQNPMMGLRGIRLGIMMPGLIKMQVRAIFEAACNAKKDGFDPIPEVMIPLTGHVNELNKVQPVLEEVAKQVMEEKGVKVKYKFGTMIEIPRAAVTASEIAKVAQFFSFGTNDLTQMTFGYSPRRRRAQLPAQVCRGRHSREEPVPVVGSQSAWAA